MEHTSTNTGLTRTRRGVWIAALAVAVVAGTATLWTFAARAAGERTLVDRIADLEANVGWINSMLTKVERTLDAAAANTRPAATTTTEPSAPVDPGPRGDMGIGVTPTPNGQLLTLRNTAGTDVAVLGVDTAGDGFEKYFNDEGVFVAYVAFDKKSNGTMRLYSRSGTYMTGFDTGTTLHNNENGNSVTYFGESDGDGYLSLKDHSGEAQVMMLASKREGLIYANGNDVAELFPAAEGAELAPGSVVCLSEGSGNPVERCRRRADPRAIGVVSGLHELGPGMVLGAGDAPLSHVPVAMAGRVVVQADADEGGPIQPGDLLVPCGDQGRACRADDPTEALEAAIGKAMSPLTQGQGTVLMLVGAR